MGVLRLDTFAGAALGPHPKLLAAAIGVVSLNQKIGRGDLRPISAPANVAVVGAARKTIYRMGRDTPSDTTLWLSWTSIVSVVRGFNTAETGERTYYTGDGFPKWTDNIKAPGGAPPVAWRALGLPAPASAPTLSAAGGVSTEAETRAYVYTYVNDIGEESAPSAASTITCKPDDTVTVASLSAAPSGSYGIDRIRVYRTETGTSGATNYFFLREIASSATSTTDDNRDLGEVLPTVGWLPAPGVPQGGFLNLTEPALHSLVPLWNGMLAGISGRGIRFCEPYIASAWPIAYEVVPVDVTPITLVAFAQTLVVLTNGKPIAIQGGTPDAMLDSSVELLQACVSVQSAVSMGHGVAWASPDGLAYVGAAGPRVLTDKSMQSEDWRALKPETIIGACFEGRYYGFYRPSEGVKRSFMVDPSYPDGIFFSDLGADAVYVDDSQDAMYILNGTNVQRWEAGAGLSATFRSKIFEQQRLTPGYAVGQVIADAYPVAVKLYADGTLRADLSVSGPDPFRIKAGYQSRTVQVEVVTEEPVQGVVLAHSVAELTGPAT